MVQKKAKADDVEKEIPFGVFAVRQLKKHQKEVIRTEWQKQFVIYNMEVQIPYRICTEENF